MNENFTKSDVIRKVTLPEKNEDLAEFIGILTGDGFANYYLSRQAYLIEVSGNKTKDFEYHKEYLKKLTKEIFNIEPKINYVKNQNTLRSIIRSKAIVSFLKDIDFPLGKKGEISVPLWILEKNNLLRKFIIGLFDTDGYLCLKNKEGKKYPVIGITSKSKSLLVPIKDFLDLSYGISSYLGTEITKDPRYKSELIIHKLQISGNKNVNLFFQKIGSNNPRNKIKYEEMGMEGIEPPPARASVVYSPTELHPHTEKQ